MSRNGAGTALLVLIAAIATTWALGTIEGKAVRWFDGIVVGVACAIGSLVGDYRRRKGTL